MSKINYIIREDGIPKLICAKSDYDFVDINEILEDYPYIVESMNNEDYPLRDDFCFMFDELLYDNKVVGFSIFELQPHDVVLLIDYYILPEFRDKGLLLHEIFKLNFSSPKFGILQPTSDLVELLVNHSIAEFVSDNIVVSGIDFYFDDFDAKSNKSDEICNDLPPSNFYDFELCSTILVDSDKVFYHDMLESDLKRYGEREALDDEYFNQIIQLLYNNEKEFEELLQKLKSKLFDGQLGYKEIIGDGEGLSTFMQSLVDDDFLSYDKALEIKQQLIEEFDSGEITNENILNRLIDLIQDVHTSSFFDEFKEFLNLQRGSTELDEEFLEDFISLIDDDEDLAFDIFKSVLSEDNDKFENLMGDLFEDGEFFNGFVDSVNEDESIYDDDYFDINSLGLNPDSPYPIAEMMWGPNDEKYKLDNTFYGKDYPFTYDNYFFKVLNTLKRTKSLNIAMTTADMNGRMTSQAVESMLFMQEFISDEVNYDNWDEFAHESLTVNDLKDILRKNNLRISGKKQELIDRIAENEIPLDEFKFRSAWITPKGEEYIRENQWVGFYLDFLNKFDFNDFVKFLGDMGNGEFIPICLNYLDKHLKLAKKEKNSQYIDDCLTAKELISKNGEDYFKK